MRRSPFFALSLLALGAVLPAACTQNFNIFGTGGGGTGGTTTTSSGGGGVGGCTANSECNDTNPCTDDECDLTTGKCSNPPVADGPLGSANVLGDCKEIRCTAGELETVADDADKPADADPCKVIDCANGSVSTTNEPNGTTCGPSPLACEDGSCVGCTMDNDCPMVGDCEQRHCTAEQICTPTNQPAGTNCTAGGGNVCDGAGACVDCVNDGDCNGTTEICSATNQCVSSCGDGTKNGNETDTDCGGPCPDCGTDKDCNTSSDCASGVCTGGAQKTCKAPTCTDTVRNGAETDTDCGGATCPKCPVGDTCVMGTDCTSGFCVGLVCVDQCHNTVKDSTESDIDCGGSSTCARCANAKNCTAGTDCTSNYCNPSGKCATPSCTDTFKNNGESDVDCGGLNCTTKCANGKDCTAGTDCTSSYCNPSGKCATPSCTDTFKNNGESDVDCGGLNCTTKCANGKDCTAGTDCTSSYCNPSGKCATPSCTDLIKNGNETDVDCGGTCPPCAVGKKCSVATDCVGSPGVCTGGICQ